MLLNCLLQMLVMIKLAHLVKTEENNCSRMRSRIAQSILEKSLLAILDQEGYEVSSECPLRPDRNMYWDNERRKWSEIANNWNCLYCGKSFYIEKFLDLHFDNRHSDTILEGPQAVCLADHCDWLRCDVISNVQKSSFWDEALCKQKDLEDLRRKCKTIIKACVPPGLSGMDKYELQDKLDSSVCSYLTCEKYWENPYEEISPERTAAYLIATVLTIFGLIMYYTMACSHLYSHDDYLQHSDGLVRTKSKFDDSRRFISFPPQDGQTIRSRPGSSQLR